MDLKQITQADVYDGEDRLRGLVDMVSFDGRKMTEIEHKTLGQVGVLKLPGRPVEPLEGKIKIGHLDDEYDRLLSHPGKVHDWQLHQKVDVNDADGYSIEKSHAIVWRLKFRFMSDDGTDMELGEKSETEYAISIPQMSITRLGDENPMWELDVWNDVFNIDGTPVYQN